MDFAICSLARISPTFCSVASLSIESTPLFSSDGISTEWVLVPLQQRPLQRDGRGLLLVAAHVAHGRQPWTACRKRCTSELSSSRLRTAKLSTHETRGQACWPCTLPVETQLRKGANPSLNNQTCSLRATPTCCPFASLVLCILLASLLVQPDHVSVPSQHLFFCASDQLGIMPQGRHTGIETGYSATKKAG